MNFFKYKNKIKKYFLKNKVYYVAPPPPSLTEARGRYRRIVEIYAGNMEHIGMLDYLENDKTFPSTSSFPVALPIRIWNLLLLGFHR